MGFLIGFGIFIGVLILYLAVIIFLPVLKVEPQPLETAPEGALKPAPDCRQDVHFLVEGSLISAWLYLPEDRNQAVPCIVMSHGFGGTKDMILENYALRFVKEGYAVLTYDFRSYGESEGTPRQLYCGPYQLDDLRAAVTYVRGREEIDPERILLWGTSAGGNYGVIIAAEDPRIAGVIAQCAAFDHKEDSKYYTENIGWGHFFKLFVHGQRDKGRSRFGLSAHTFPAYGRPGTTAMFTMPGVYEGIQQITGNSRWFVNETCARLSLLPHAPDPIRLAEKVKCPVLLLVCEFDGIVSPRSHLRIAATLGSRARVVEFPISHFEIYQGEYFEKAVSAQIEFVKSALSGNRQ